VRIYTRTGNDVTRAAPEIVAAVRSAQAQTLILDGEAIVLKPGGAPYPFQDTMRRFGRVLDIEVMRASMPLSVFFFDCLRRDQNDLVSVPASARFEAMSAALPSELLIPRVVTSDAAAARAMMMRSARTGCDGQALEAP
jgi:DNA ligase-1